MRLARTDSRYQLDVIKGKGSGMWRLEARRGLYVGQGPKLPLPLSVVAAWRSAYSGRQPSKKQVVVLQELVERRGSLWVTVRLTQGGADAFQAILTADREQTVTDRTEIVARERAWEEEKRSYQQPALGPLRALQEAASSDEPQAIGAILRGLMMPASEGQSE